MNLIKHTKGKKQDTKDHMLYDFIENIKKKRLMNMYRQINPWNRRWEQRSNSKVHVRGRWGDENVPKLFMVMVAQPGEFAKNQ